MCQIGQYGKYQMQILSCLKKKMQCHSAVMENKSGILLNWEITDGGIETDKCNRF